MLSSLLELNDTQEGVLNVAFRVADEEGLLLLDLEDLRALLRFVADNAKQFSRQYGNISSASVAAIQRRLLVLEEQGAEYFFGEPALELADIQRLDLSGRGVINVLAADRADTQAAPVRHVPAVAVVRVVRGTTRSRRPGETAPGVLSSTKPTCCSTTPHARWSPRSNRWCA